MSSLHSSERSPVRATESARSESSRISRLLISLGLFIGSLCVRLTTWHTVFQPDGIYPPASGDPFYHLRRIRYAVDNYPEFLSFDPLINFPAGAQPIWSPTFDWVVAMWVRVLIGPGDTEALERVVMWVPPILGALTVVAVYFLGQRFFSKGVGIGAACLLGILPAHFKYSQLGLVDHHVAVAMISVGILWAGMALFEKEPDFTEAPTGSPTNDARGLAVAAWLGFVVGAAVLVWPGCLIHAAVVQVALLARVFLSRDLGRAVCWARRFTMAQGVTCLIVLPFSAGNEWARWGSFSPVVLSNFQPIYFSAAAIVLGCSTVVWQRWERCVKPSVRFALSLTIGLVLASLLFGTIPALRAGPQDAWGWMSRDEAFQSVVAESVPIMMNQFGFDWHRPSEIFGFPLFLAPVALIVCAIRDRKRGDRAFFLWWAAVFFAATMGQRRFMNTYAIGHALLLAHVVGIAYRASSRFRYGRARSPWMRVAVVAALLLLLMAPIRVRYEPHLANLIRVCRGEAAHLSGAALRLRPTAITAKWLRSNTPEPVGDGYSVLARWDSGHIIKYLAERAVVQDNFGDDVAVENFEISERYFVATDEAEALELLDQTRTRYVVVRNGGSGHGSGYGPETIFSRLFLIKGSSGQIKETRSEHRVPVDALERHRLIYESPLPPGWTTLEKRPYYASVFEIVPGALVVGNAPPSTEVVVRLELRSHNGEVFAYRSVVAADESGRYAVRLPYSNESMASDVRAASHYKARSGDVSATFVVPEEAVLKGLHVEGPDFTMLDREVVPGEESNRSS